MNTLLQDSTIVNLVNWNSEPVLSADERAYRHGEDRAVLGLSRENCTNDRQAQGWDHMTAQMDAWQRCAADGPCSFVDDWAAALYRRQQEADRRRAWALAIEAEADAILVEMDSPFFSGHEHEMEVA